MLSLWILGGIALFGMIFVFIRFWTSKRRAELDSDEFAVWFQKNYMGMNAPVNTRQACQEGKQEVVSPKASK